MSDWRSSLNTLLAVAVLISCTLLISAMRASALASICSRVKLFSFFANILLSTSPSRSYRVRRSFSAEPFSVLSFRLTITGVPSLKNTVFHSLPSNITAMQASLSAVPLNENLPPATARLSIFFSVNWSIR